MSNNIPTTLLFCTTVVASACTKSNEKLAEDICNLNFCGASDEQLEAYGEEINTYLEECITEGTEYINELEGECGTTAREFYICISDLSCEQYQEAMENENGPCAEQAAAFYECDYGSSSIEIDEDIVYEADQYEPDDSIDEASEIVPGESQERTLQDSADVDVVIFTAVEGKTYTIETSITEGEYTDTELTLYTSESSYIDENDDKGEDTYESLIEWTAPTSGVYTIEVTTLSPGPYGLILSES